MRRQPPGRQLGEQVRRPLCARMAMRPPGGEAVRQAARPGAQTRHRDPARCSSAAIDQDHVIAVLGDLAGDELRKGAGMALGICGPERQTMVSREARRTHSPAWVAAAT
jgi:hypothetical protein